MQLSLPEDSVPVKEMFERFFATESTSARVRAAEPVGFDAELWKELVALEVPFMRLSGDAGGSEMSLFDACLMMEQAVLCAVELALDAGVATKTHVLNILHRLTDGKAIPPTPIDAPQALRLAREPLANVGRYDALRNKEARHAS